MRVLIVGASGERQLDRAVLVTQGGVRTQRVAQPEVVAQAQAAVHDDVGVLAGRVRRRTERPTIHDAHVAEWEVAGDDECGGRRVDVRPLDDDVDIDHRLRRQTGHGRAADVLDRQRRHPGEGGPQRGRDHLEASGPGEVVRHDDQRAGHRCKALR